MRLLLKNCSILGKEIKDILIENGYIINIGKSFLKAQKTIDINGNIVLPGAIDPHVHFRDPGFTYKEDWLSGSKGAASAGITTVLDMPNTNPPTINKTGLLEKRKTAKKSIVNYGFHFGATGNNFSEMEKTKNIAGIKVFLSSNASFIIEDKDVLKKVFETAKKINKPVIVHSEDNRCIKKHSALFMDPTIYDHNKIRSRECAIKSTDLILKLAKETEATLYIAHITTKEELKLIEKAKEEDVNVFAEVTPNHLFLDESCLSRLGNFAKVNPPLRTAEDREALFKAAISGKIDTIGTDHAPHTKKEKMKPFILAPSGMPGVETMMPLLIDAFLKNKLDFERLSEITAKNASQIFKIKKRGTIKEGFFADLIVVNPKETFLIQSKNLFTKAKFTPFDGMILKGRIYLTIVNGIVKFFNGKIVNTSSGKEVEFYE